MEPQLSADSQLLRIFIGENDKVDHRPLYEALLFAAKQEALAGATVLRGIMAYGASSRIHTAKLIDISQDLPIVVEIVDHKDKIDHFMVTVKALMDRAGCGGLITMEKAQVLYYTRQKGNDQSESPE
jgi:PII-like signaling protein